MNKKIIGIYSVIYFFVDLVCAILVSNLVTQKIGISMNLFVAIHFLSELQYLFDIKYDYVEKILFWLPIIMCIISDVVRKKSEKKSNIIFFISICLVCLNSIILYINYN